MESEVIDRFEHLIEKGKAIIAAFPRDEYGLNYWSEDVNVPNIQSWIQSSANLISIVAPSDRPIFASLNNVINDQNYVTGTSVPGHTVQKIQGLLEATYEEMKLGFFKKLEYIVVAETLDDFLDHAVKFHKSNKKIEAAVLSSIVLEDSVKKIAKKNDVDGKGKSLDELIDDLVKNEVLTGVKGKRVKGICGVRNHALHAEWDEFDIKDVGEQIKGVQNLIEEFL